MLAARGRGDEPQYIAIFLGLCYSIQGLSNQLSISLREDKTEMIHALVQLLRQKLTVIIKAQTKGFPIDASSLDKKIHINLPFTQNVTDVRTKTRDKEMKRKQP